ncbi:hypothetical protein D915_009261 [Fasciola hepatica]|uniref:Retrotransposon gag domain-containing protein n=1 Tax=Fasciola hepatica TaxID=6192 RepID=A0A4E0RD84_FASHE|nr:hypothetical protein D915_009261 [Fasciola hepatica]
MGHLDGEAQDIARDEGMFDKPISENTFKRLEQCPTEHRNLTEYRLAFHQLLQKSGENLAAMAREFRRLSEDAFPELSRQDRKTKVLDQVSMGVRDAILRKKFLTRPPSSLPQALETAWRIEQEQAVVQRDQLVVHNTIAAADQRPNSSENQRNRWPRGDGISHRPWNRGPRSLDQRAQYPTPRQDLLLSTVLQMSEDVRTQRVT